MATAQKGDHVKVHYSGRLEDGTEFDSSQDAAPLEFTIGNGEVIPGFENAVVEMAPGESKTVTIPAEQGYGPHQEEMVATIERKGVPEDVDLVVGNQLEVSQEGGQSFVVTVTEVTEETVTLDANHPLAGKDLTFDIRLEEIS